MTRAATSLLFAVLTVLLSACGSAPPPPAAAPQKAETSVPQPIPVPAPAAPPAAVAATEPPRANIPFPNWLEEVRREALAKGIKAATLDAAFAGLVPSDRVIALDRAQFDGKNSYMSYLRRHITGGRIASAQAAYRSNVALLEAAEKAHGVPAQVIVGIWGMETNFGGFTGNFPTIQALATLAYDGRRASLFRQELMAALTMIDRGDATIGQLRGSWAGAFGQPQFMPSSYLRYAVDGDASGNRDLWTSLPDVFGSIGNYLKQNGWSNPGEGWGLAVAPPAGFDPATVANPAEPNQCKPALRKHSLPKPIAEWKALGFVPNGTNGWPADTTPATLVFPDGIEGPAFLTLPNYRAILSYNCSNYYALSVLMLADAARQ